MNAVQLQGLEDSEGHHHCQVPLVTVAVCSSFTSEINLFTGQRGLQQLYSSLVQSTLRVVRFPGHAWLNVSFSQQLFAPSSSRKRQLGTTVPVPEPVQLGLQESVLRAEGSAFCSSGVRLEAGEAKARANAPALKNMFQHINLFSSLGWRVGSWWPGIVLAIVGSILNNVGTNIMKLAINRRLLLPPDERPRLSRLPMWSGGFAMFALGTAMSFGAFKFAAQSLLSGLGSVQFLSQVFFSRFILHEKIEKYAYLGVGLIISGCVFIVIFGAHGTKNYRPEELAALYGRSEYVCYLLGAGFLLCVVSIAYSSMKQRIMRDRGLGRFDIAKATIRERQILAVFFSIKSALFGTQAVVLAKSLSMLLIQALHPNPAYSNPLYSYQTYFIILGFIAAATYWVTRLNHGLRLFEAVYLIPMMQICWILFSTIAGGIYYEEFIGFGRKEYGAYAAGFICVLIGVAMLCPRDDATSLNAADVIYDIVSEENPLVSQHSQPKFQPFSEDEEREDGGRRYRVVRSEEYDTRREETTAVSDSRDVEAHIDSSVDTQPSRTGAVVEVAVGGASGEKMV